MLVLAIDTATAATAVALLGIDQAGEVDVRARRRHVDPRAHGELLAPQIGEVLTETGARPAELSAVVAGTGPGPFTGLRVGLVTAAAMADSLGIPTYGVCSLDGIGTRAGERTLVATDARRREIYWAVYRDGRRLTEPAVDRPGDLADTLTGYGVTRALGEGALRYRNVLGLPVGDDNEESLYPDPVALVRVARERVAVGAPGERLVPRYLRRPDAAEPGPAKPATALRGRRREPR